MELGHEQTSKKGRVLLPDRSLGELPQENGAAIHDGPKIKPALAFSNDPTHELSAQEGIKPRENRPLGLADKKRELALPIEVEVLIGNGRKEARPELPIDKKLPQVKERPAPCRLKEGKDRVREYRCHLIAPTRREATKD